MQTFVRREGYFPSIRQLGLMMGLSSPATVHAYLKRLQRRGLVEYSSTAGWSLGSGFCEIPLVGIVPAGSPQEIFSSLGEEVAVPDWMIGKGQALAFRVSGDSMRDAFIQDGDVVVVRPSVTAEIGEMVVALLEEGGVTLKRLIRHGQAYALKPENPDYSVIHGPFSLVGKVIGVLRSYR